MSPKNAYVPLFQSTKEFFKDLLGSLPFITFSFHCYADDIQLPVLPFVPYQLLGRNQKQDLKQFSKTDQQ